MASNAASSIAVQPRRTLATGRVSGLKLGSFMNQGRSRLSFRMRPMPARLQICCAANKETLDKVCDIVRDKLSVVKSTSITGESTFEGLGADSLDTVELVMALEEEFDIQMDEEAAQNIKTVQDAAELIEKLGNK